MIPLTQGNIVQAGIPSKSALMVAKLRAVHQLLDDPVVFADSFALPILGAETERELREDPFQLNDPMSRGLRASLVVRSRLAEDSLQKATEAGVKQYVILGAGLDTYALRNHGPGRDVRVFEVDHPATQHCKKAMLVAGGLEVPPSTTFVGVNFETETLADALGGAGFCADRPAFFSWMGVTVYLSKHAVFETLKYVASLPQGSAVIFDYWVDPALLNPIERMIGGFVGERIAEQGEPWISYFEPVALQKDLQSIGFNLTSDFGPNELNARYLARRKDGLRAGGLFRIMRAQV